MSAHTISSALKNDHGQPEIKEKLRELAVGREINYVTPVDKTRGRPPFVVRRVSFLLIYRLNSNFWNKFDSIFNQVDKNLIDRKPSSHSVMNDALTVDDYTLARPDTALSTSSLEAELVRSRPVSPLLGRSIQLTRSRTRSPSPTRRSAKLSQSGDFERSRSPTRSLYNAYDAGKFQ